MIYDKKKCSLYSIIQLAINSIFKIIKTRFELIVIEFFQAKNYLIQLIIFSCLVIILSVLLLIFLFSIFLIHFRSFFSWKFICAIIIIYIGVIYFCVHKIRRKINNIMFSFNTTVCEIKKDLDNLYQKK